jgi:hypothetical protein
LCPVSLRTPSSSRSPDHVPHRTIYYLGYPLGRFAGLKHRQLARQVGVIITTGRIRRTLINKINLLADSLRSIEASRLAPVKAESIFLRRASGCFGTSRGSSSITSPMPHVQVPRHVARLVMQLIVDYFASAACPVALARRAARHVALRRLLRLRRASGCLGTSRGSSRGLSSTTSTTLRVRLLRHVARFVALLAVDYSASHRLVVDYFAYSARSGASARRAARLTARRRLLRLRRTSGCLSTSRGSSHGSSSTTPCAATSSCGHIGSTSATPCVVTTCLVATLALHQLRYTPPRRRLLVASRRPFISTSFRN